VGKIVEMAAQISLVLAMAVSAAAEPVDLTKATPGYTYFNRPGATRENYAADFGDCFSLAVSRIPGGKIEPSGKVSGDLNPIYTGIIPGLLANRQHQARTQNNLENCMVVRGWREMRVDDARGAQLWEGDRAALAQELDIWAGASAPPGEVVRSFSNDAARNGTVVSGVPNPLGQSGLHSLSMRAFDPRGLKPLPAPKPFYYAGWGSKFLARPLDANKLEAVAPDTATVVLSLKGDVRTCIGCLGFQRAGPSDDVLAFDADGRPDLFYFDKRSTLEAGDEKVQVFALPPGKWRVSHRGNLEMCLGAPSFDVKAGQVLYLGRFDMTAEVLGPDMDMDSVKSRLANAPGIVARMQPATWTNGAAWPCHNWLGFYALEFKDSPHEHGNGSGSAARPTSDSR